MKRRTLQGKRLIITGASSGIGRDLAIEAARRGSDVIATARNEENLAETARMIRQTGGSVETVSGDVTDPADRERIINAAEQYFGGLDLLINNAGVGATGHFQDASPARLRQIMEVNFFAPCELCRLAIPLLKAGSDPCLLMIGSIVGRRAIPARPEYSASKFALTGFAEALRAELSKDDIEVMLVSPGLIDTRFEENMLENRARFSVHSQRMMSVEKAASLTLDALERRKKELTLTLRGKLLLLANRFVPRFVDRQMAKFVRKLYSEEQKQ